MLFVAGQMIQIDGFIPSIEEKWLSPVNRYFSCREPIGQSVNIVEQQTHGAKYKSCCITSRLMVSHLRLTCPCIVCRPLRGPLQWLCVEMCNRERVRPLVTAGISNELPVDFIGLFLWISIQENLNSGSYIGSVFRSICGVWFPISRFDEISASLVQWMSKVVIAVISHRLIGKIVCCWFQ